jgi:hypothetical protein
MTADATALRTQLTRLLRGEDAHMDFLEAVASFPDDAINVRPPNVTYTPWHLVEHVRITQRDMLDYVRDPAYVSPDWPVGYWPDRAETATPAEFAASVDAFRQDRAEFAAMVADTGRDLATPIPHTHGHSLARCVRIVADHTAYHTGEFAILRQVMGTWPAERPA